jgi:hypothetical protein
LRSGWNKGCGLTAWRPSDYVTLTDDELDAMADHGTWPERFG